MICCEAFGLSQYCSHVIVWHPRSFLASALAAVFQSHGINWDSLLRAGFSVMLLASVIRARVRRGMGQTVDK